MAPSGRALGDGWGTPPPGENASLAKTPTLRVSAFWLDPGEEGEGGQGQREGRAEVIRETGWVGGEREPAGCRETVGAEREKEIANKRWIDGWGSCLRLLYEYARTLYLKNVEGSLLCLIPGFRV